MSLASRQALVQLSVVAGCFRSMQQCNCFSRVDIRQLIGRTIEQIYETVAIWPCSGDERKNHTWIAERLRRWKEFLAADPDTDYSTAVMAKMCERILSALDEVTRNRDKRRLLAPILEASITINSICDPEAANFPAYDKCDFLLHELYEIIEWPEYA